MSTSYAGDELVRELGSVDLGVLAQEAAADQKQLMLVYYDNDCKACDELNQLYNAAGAKGSQLERDFVIHKTNVSTGFNITCPNGQEFADNEFMAMKGITKLPALVITDSEGNVTANLIRIYTALGGGWDPADLPDLE